MVCMHDNPSICSTEKGKKKEQHDADVVTNRAHACPTGRNAHTIGAVELSSVMWALAKLDVRLPPPLLTPLLKQAESLVDRNAIDGQACSLTLWATAVLSGTTTPLFRKLFRRQVEFGLTGMDPRAVQQLFQVLLLAQAQGGEGDAAGRALMRVMPPEMRREVFRMWRQQVKAVSASLFQQEVSNVLERMRIPHANEYLTEGGLFSVDIAIVGAANKVGKVCVLLLLLVCACVLARVS